MALIEAIENQVLLPENSQILYPVFRLILQLLYDEGQLYIIFMLHFVFYFYLYFIKVEYEDFVF